MTTTKIRVTAANNADARRMDGCAIPGAEKVTHNGGKTVIILSRDVAATTAWLDNERRVSGYDVEGGSEK